MRKSEITRTTRETDITVALELDGTGKSSIDTGIPFMNHMLELFAKHGFFDLEVRAKGDIEVDYHHTMEDLGLVLGQALAEALGDKAGIRRYGSCILPMDETLALVALELRKKAERTEIDAHNGNIQNGRAQGDAKHRAVAAEHDEPVDLPDLLQIAVNDRGMSMAADVCCEALCDGGVSLIAVVKDPEFHLRLLYNNW